MKLVVEHPEPPTRTKLLLSAFFFAAAIVALFFLSGCGSLAKVPPRSQARAAVTVTAESVRAFGEVCARYSIATVDLELAEKCEAAYDAARISLITTAAAVDGWSGSQTVRESLICALRRALSQLNESVRYLESKGLSQDAYTDALSLVSLLGACYEVRP